MLSPDRLPLTLFHRPLCPQLLERNYHKSLDHRSFYFGQSDKKAIQPKMLVQEIKVGMPHW